MDNNDNLPDKIETISEMMLERNTILETAQYVQQFRSKLNGFDDIIFQKYYDAEKFRKDVDISFWLKILEKSFICSGMLESEKGKFQKSLYDNPPVFDAVNLKAFADNANRIFVDGIKTTLNNVFENFTNTNYSSDWRNKKIDNCRKIEKSFRCRAGIYYNTKFKSWDYRCGFNTGYYISNSPNFEDLLTACCILDGKPNPNYSNNFYQHFHEQVKTWGNSENPKIETEYFTVTAHKNGNQLVHFKRLDILEMLNMYGATNQLPESFKKKYKPEHFESGVI